MDFDYTGPNLSQALDGSYSITQDFVDGLLEHYRNGGSLPRRYVWEIVLACAELLKKEETLVDVRIEEGMTCDVIGDVHGALIHTAILAVTYRFYRTIL